MSVLRIFLPGYFLTITFALGGMLSLPVKAGPDPFAELDQAAATYQPSTVDKKKELAPFQKFKNGQLKEYKNYKHVLIAEFAEYKQIVKEETRKYKNQLKTIWDKPALSSRKVWVSYSDNLKQKRQVDFEHNKILLSVVVNKKAKVSEKEIRQTLRKLVTENKAEAFHADKISQGVERRSRQKIVNLKTSIVRPVPILIPYLTGSNKVKRGEVKKIVDTMMSSKKRTVVVNKKGMKVVTVEVPLKAPASAILQFQPPAQPKAMQKFRRFPVKARILSPTVYKFAKKSRLDGALVFAIIETESAFNPMARSGVPAYGLMQIVPRSAGQDATQKLFGKAKILSPSYLYNSNQNVEIGTTYLNIIYYRYFSGIKNPESRLYCTIAAYNTGVGNVAKAFVGVRRLKPAFKVINSLTPEHVYARLLKKLPYPETRHYISRVRNRMPKYEM